MTNDSADFITLKEASILLDKSVRTVKRYLEKLGKYDKDRLSTLSNGRIMVSPDFVKMAKNGDFSKGKKEPVQEIEEPKKHNESARIEALETQNKELFEIIKKKDGQLQEKDELIKENLRDFKMLTSKVLSLQEQNVQLQQPKKEEVIKREESTKTDALLLFLFVAVLFGMGLIAFLLLG